MDNPFDLDYRIKILTRTERGIIPVLFNGDEMMIRDEIDAIGKPKRLRRRGRRGGRNRNRARSKD